MRIHEWTQTVTLSLGVVAVISCGIVGVLLLENRELQRDLRSARAQWREAAADIDHAREERAAEQVVREKADERVRAMETKLAALEETQAAAEARLARGNQAKAVRVQTFLGQQYLGESWVVQSSSGPEGSPSRSPVVVLDPAVAGQLAKQAEREPEPPTPQTVHVNYNSSAQPSYPYGYGWWPTYWVAGSTNRPGHRPPSLPPGTKPTPPSSSLREHQGQGVFYPSSVWRPTQPPIRTPTPLGVPGSGLGAMGTGVNRVVSRSVPVTPRAFMPTGAGRSGQSIGSPGLRR